MSDNNNGNGYAGRDVATQMRIMAWFNKNKASLLQFESRSKVCDALLADTGLDITVYMCGQYEKALGVHRSRRKWQAQAGNRQE